MVLHTDARLLPRNRKTWSSWNYSLGANNERAVVTYNMNILQGITAPETFCVTLNDSAAINPATILGRFSYEHPVFSIAGIAAQPRWGEINGPRNTGFCGAYWHDGFHEEWVWSGRLWLASWAALGDAIQHLELSRHEILRQNWTGPMGLCPGGTRAVARPCQHDSRGQSLGLLPHKGAVE